jgi:hypothetical protein
MPGVRDPSRAGSVNWYPLGPREVYVPTYHATPRHVRGVNISNTNIDRNSQITNAWRGRVREPHANRDVPGAMSSLPAAAFSGERLRVGSVRAVNPAAGVPPAPHLSTLHSGTASANSWREADSRRTVPPVPTDRRAFQSTPSASSTAADTSKLRRREPPPKHLSDLQRAVPANSLRVPGSQPAARAPTRTANPESAPSDRGGAVRAGGRAERPVSGNADSRPSTSGRQLNRGGESRASAASSQSGRASAQSSGRSGGGARMSSGSRSGRTGGVSAQP